jgi:hypothetical protein
MRKAAGSKIHTLLLILDRTYLKISSSSSPFFSFCTSLLAYDYGTQSRI